MRFMAFIGKLQVADQATKRRWLVVMTAVAMALVLLVWLKYFNSLVAPGGASPASLRQEGADFSLGKSARGSASVIFHGALEKIRGLGGVLGEPKEYFITPPEGE